jgi:hypothetical protein
LGKVFIDVWIRLLGAGMLGGGIQSKNHRYRSVFCLSKFYFKPLGEWITSLCSVILGGGIQSKNHRYRSVFCLSKFYFKPLA